MNKALLLLFGILLIAGGVFSIVMTIMAAIFMEYGRVFFYMTIAVVCLALSVTLFMKLKESQS
ncbi:MAG: hypothetical protein IKT52_07085 [Oscillospiraceae bacterium]|nr:hypothetical protein [Oscillospiraceae bacterium]